MRLPQSGRHVDLDKQCLLIEVGMLRGLSLTAHGVCGGVDWGLWLTEIPSRGRTTIEPQARSDGLRLLRTINDTHTHGEEGARADPTRAAHEAGLDVGSERYQDAMAYLIEQAALLGDEHTAFDVGDQHPHGTLPTSSPGGL